IFAAEFSHLERTGLRRGFPVHMAGGILRHVFTNAVEGVAATPHEGFEFAGNQGKDFEKLVSRFDCWVYKDGTGQGDSTSFSQKGKWKTGGQTEALFSIAATPLEAEFQVGGQLAVRRKVGKIGEAIKDPRSRTIVDDAPYAPIGQSDPLLFRGTLRRETEHGWLPDPFRPSPLLLGRYNLNRKRRKPAARVVQQDPTE